MGLRPSGCGGLMVHYYGVHYYTRCIRVQKAETHTLIRRKISCRGHPTKLVTWVNKINYDAHPPPKVVHTSREQIN
jgi:hypothetical protein